MQRVGGVIGYHCQEAVIQVYGLAGQGTYGEMLGKVRQIARISFFPHSSARNGKRMFSLFSLR